jgi:hypothetical protein
MKSRNLNLIEHSGPVYGCTRIALLLPLPSPKHPLRLWDPLSLLFNWRPGHGLNLTTHLHTMPSVRMDGVIPPLPSEPSC